MGLERVVRARARAQVQVQARVPVVPVVPVVPEGQVDLGEVAPMVLPKCFWVPNEDL